MKARPGLAGRGVLVTRAAHQAEPLCALITARGGRPIRFPALEIGPARGAGPEALLADAARSDLAVFVSPNAVEFGLRALGGRLPQGLKAAGVGRATARALAAGGVESPLRPAAGFDSEALLALPEMQQMAGRRVLIFRGNEGRPLLGDSLRARGAEVHYAEVYRRSCPQTDPAPLIRCWPEAVDRVALSSVQALEHLVQMLGDAGRPLLNETPATAVSERMAARAAGLGLKRVVRAASAHDEDVAAALEAVSAPL